MQSALIFSIPVTYLRRKWTLSIWILWGYLFASTRQLAALGKASCRCPPGDRRRSWFL